MRNFIFGCLVCLLFALPVCAQDDATKTLLVKPIAEAKSFEKRALVIGINGYERVAQLRVCRSDAQKFAAYLHDKMGFPSSAITLMTDDATTPQALQPTGTRIKSALNTLLQGVNGNSEVVVYFSGHGVRSGDEDYLVPQDGDPALINDTCVSYDKFKRQLETRRPRRALLVIDACRNLQDAKSVVGSGFKGGQIVGPQIAELLSCQPSEVSRERKELDASVFTHFLLDGLNGDVEAQSDNGLVTFDSLKAFVQGKVSQYVEEKFQSTQNPDGYAKFGAMVISRAAPVVILPIVQPVTPPITITLPNNPATPLTIGSTKINPKDGAKMVYVPAGEFTRGSDKYDDEKPVRKIYLDGYWIYDTEVTVKQYRAFCNMTGRQMPRVPEWGFKDDHPVVNVSWENAKAYCDWAGVSLPTEAQWEKAARGEDGREYPWGNTFSTKRLWSSKGVMGSAHGTTPVGRFPEGVSPYGCLDMAGNAWEWCADWYAKDYYEVSPVQNPSGPIFGTERVLRGGAWNHFESYTFCASLRRRFQPGTIDPSLGFRCVQSQP